MRIAMLCSHRAPGLDALLRSPHHGTLFEIVLCLSSEEAFAGTPELYWQDISCTRRPLRRFHAEHQAPLSDRRVRALYDAETAGLLHAYAIDRVFLDSYLYVLTEPMLNAFPDRILNIHDADLSLREAGRPLYCGLHATQDAILGGETETRATVHFVTDELDAGPPLLRSWPFPVLPGIKSHMRRRLYDAVRHYAAAHREWVMEDAWGVLLSRAAELMATDRVTCRGDSVWIDQRPAPWEVLPDGRLAGDGIGAPISATPRSSARPSRRNPS
jgi:folate-dependent phosphoribosylglycinamide formyltransferase PurN